MLVESDPERVDDLYEESRTWRTEIARLITRYHRAAIGIVGLALVGYLLHTVGTDAVLGSFRVLSWRVVFVMLLPALLLKVTDARAWSALIRPQEVGLSRLLRALVAGHAVAAVNPTGTFGGDAVKVLMIQDDLPRRDAVASLIIAETTSTASQGVFLAIGLVLASYCLGSGTPLIRFMWWLVLLETFAIAAFIALQLQGVAARGARFLERLGISASYLPAAALHVDDSLSAFYRHHRSRLTASFAWHLLGWLLGAVEVAFILYLTGRPVSCSTALIIEALGTGISFATFFMPVQWGIDEGGAVAIFTLLGLDPAAGLSLALVRRAREATWVAIGLTVLSLAPPSLRRAAALRAD